MSDKIAIKNTANGFGLIAIALHWIIAIAFIVNYGLVYYSDWFLEPRSELGRALTSTHTAIGVSVVTFVIIRIVWRSYNVQPDNPPGGKLEHLAAHAAHFLLYAVMIVLPLTGYFGYGGTTNLFFAIELPSFRDTWLFDTVISGAFGLSWDSFEGVMDLIHKQGATYVVSVLIVAHILAAIYHHSIRKDDVLKRMTSPKIASE